MIEIPFVAEWISKLTGRLVVLRGKRAKEIQAISDVLGTDAELLARYYVQPRAQTVNPANQDEDKPLEAGRVDLREVLNKFVSQEYIIPIGHQFFFILADAGMGKSSLLAMIKLTHLLKFWPQEIRIELLKLGPNTLADVKALPQARKTVLLLDSLDEDPTAFGNVKARLEDLMTATKGFRQVIITCRTQFIPKDADIEKPGRISVGDFQHCRLLYLSPFSDQQVGEYLEKRFADEGTRVRAWEVVGKMRSLRMRPMLLAYIEHLIDDERADWNDFTIYESLVETWLSREAQKKDIDIDRERLKDACLLLARRLQIDGKRHYSPDDFAKLTLKHPELAEIPKLKLEGRALLNCTSRGEFRFAHFSIQEFLAVAGLAWGRFDYMDGIFARTEMTDVFARGTRWNRGRSVGAVHFPESPFLAGADFRTMGAAGNHPLHRLNLSGVNLVEANLRGAVLRRRNLTGTWLRGAILASADLRGANLTKADLSGADLTSADLRGAKVTNEQLAAAIGRPIR